MEKSTLKIEGMTCEHCVGSVTKALKNLEGVSSVSVTLEGKNAKVEYDAEKVSLLDITKAIEGDGFEVKGLA